MQHSTTGTGGHRRALVLLTQVCVDGGIQRFNRTFLSASSQLGVSCDVLSLGDTEESRGRWDPPEFVKIRPFNQNKVRFALALVDRVLRGKYDFIVIGHINLVQLVAAAAALRIRRKSRVLLVAHGIEVWDGLERWRFKLAMAGVDLILSVSRYTAERIRAQRPELTAERHAIFPNALSETWLQRFRHNVPFESTLQLPGRFLLSVTRLDRGDRYKGLTTVIETLAMLEDTSVHYVIAGRGDDQQFLREMADRFELGDRVHFLGGVSDAQLAHLYAKCSAFVLPSGKEGFGIVFLEAMHFGAPVIGAREKGTVDVIQDGDTGLLVPYGDTVALAAAITRILEDGALRDRLRRNGNRSVGVEGPFSFKAYVARLGKVLDVSS